MATTVPYCGQAPAPSELIWRWNLDPLVLGPLLLAAVVVLYVGARLRLDRRLFLTALLVLAVSFVSPLCALSSALFSARVTHHGLMVIVAAPLLAYALPAPSSRSPGLWITGVAHAALFWFWHAPRPYAAALSHDGLYWLMQASLLIPGVLFWRAVRQASPAAAAAGLLGMMMQMGLLGALITFAAQPLYLPHFVTTELWGLSPLSDQQLAGLIMWAPMGGAYLLAALALVGRMLGSDAPRSATA